MKRYNKFLKLVNIIKINKKAVIHILSYNLKKLLFIFIKTEIQHKFILKLHKYLFYTFIFERTYI